MAQPTVKVFFRGGSRDLQSINIDRDNANNILDISEILTIGTNGFSKNEVLFYINLSGIPNNIIITSATLALNVTTAAPAGTDAELAVEIMPICLGLDVDFKRCTYNSYDGINPWPLNRYDSLLRHTDAMPTSTGLWGIDIKAIVNDALSRGEDELIIVIKRVQQASTHKSVEISSDAEPVNTECPILVIIHSVPNTPDTIIKKGRLTLVTTPKHRKRVRVPYGFYDLDGQDLLISEDGQIRLRATGGNLHLWAAGAPQMIIKDGGIDGGGTKRLSNWAGMIDRWQFSWATANTQTNRRLYVVATTFSGVLGGLFIPDRAGSITGLFCWCDVNIIGTGGTVRMESRINDSIKLVANLTASVANGLVFSATAALGVHTFVAGDKLSGNRLLTDGGAGQITTDDMGMIITMEYD